MKFISCPYCDEPAIKLRHILLPFLFWIDFHKKCCNCSGAVKIDYNSTILCSTLFFVALFLLSFLFTFFGPSITTNTTVVVESEFRRILMFFLEALPVLFIFWLSFEIPARYFNKRLFIKREKTWIG